MTIPEVNKEDNGAVYTCIVTSPSGEMARRSFEIQVIEAPILEDLLLGNNLQEGQIVNIYCNVRSGDLPIHFEWLKDGKRISSNLKVHSQILHFIIIIPRDLFFYYQLSWIIDLFKKLFIWTTSYSYQHF